MSVVQFVITINCAIALFGFFVTWRLWQIKRTLTRATVALTLWEQVAHRTLNPETTPQTLLQGQRTTADLRHRYARLQAQLNQLERIFSLALMAFKVLPLSRNRSWQGNRAVRKVR